MSWQIYANPQGKKREDKNRSVTLIGNEGRIKGTISKVAWASFPSGPGAPEMPRSCLERGGKKRVIGRRASEKELVTEVVRPVLPLEKNEKTTSGSKARCLFWTGHGGDTWHKPTSTKRVHV